MKLAINQPYFFPYIGYFQLIESVDIFIMYGNLKFVKETWMNRNQLLGKGNKQAFLVSLPIENKNKTQLIKNVRISKNSRMHWIGEMEKHLLINYAKADYFKEIFALIMEIVSSIDSDYLQGFNAYSIQQICAYLDIDTAIVNDDNRYLKIEVDLLEMYNKDKQEEDLIEKKTMRIIKFCKFLKATTFHNLPGGTILYDKSFFKEQGINLNFIEMPKVQYKQFDSDFVPHLSIIDVLMHNGKEGTQQLIKDYNLV